MTTKKQSGGSVLTQEFFDRQLEKVREIRLSERKFYQKLTDLYSTSVDQDRAAAATQRFFARLFESDFERVVAETKQLASNGPSASPPKPRKGKKS